MKPVRVLTVISALESVVHESADTPVVVTPAEYEVLKREVSAEVGERCEQLVTIAGHPVLVVYAPELVEWEETEWVFDVNQLGR